MNKKSFIICCLLLLLLLPQKIIASENAAYLVSRITSYANPKTGKIEDGGANIDLGNNMANNIIEKQLMIEKYDGKAVLTMGIGLADNIKNVKMFVNDKLVVSKVVNYTQKGNNRVDHYQFLAKENDLIKISMYVIPMKRDVIFFVKVGNDLKKGSGIYKTTLNTEKKVKAGNKKITTNKQKEVKVDKYQSQKSNKKVLIKYQDPFKNIEGISKNFIKKDSKIVNQNYLLISIGSLLFLTITLGFGYLIYRKKRK